MKTMKPTKPAINQRGITNSMSLTLLSVNWQNGWIWTLWYRTSTWLGVGGAKAHEWIRNGEAPQSQRNDKASLQCGRGVHSISINTISNMKIIGVRWIIIANAERILKPSSSWERCNHQHFDSLEFSTQFSTDYCWVITHCSIHRSPMLLAGADCHRLLLRHYSLQHPSLCGLPPQLTQSHRCQSQHQLASDLG